MNNYDELLKTASKKLGVEPNELKNKLERNDLNLKGVDMNKVNRILNNKEELEKVLNSQKAKELIKQFMNK